MRRNHLRSPLRRVTNEGGFETPQLRGSLACALARSQGAVLMPTGPPQVICAGSASLIRELWQKKAEGGASGSALLQGEGGRRRRRVQRQEVNAQRGLRVRIGSVLALWRVSSMSGSPPLILSSAREAWKGRDGGQQGLPSAAARKEGGTSDARREACVLIYAPPCRIVRRG